MGKTIDLPDFQAKSEYLFYNLLKVSPDTAKDEDTFKIQIVSEHGKTNWLNINGEQFKKIERVLFEGV